MFDAATFACPNECGRCDLAYHGLITHINTECPKKVVVCSNGCGEYVKADLEKVHQNLTCKNSKVTCEACNKEIKYRKLLESH
jgi:hypothetical protein